MQNYLHFIFIRKFSNNSVQKVQLQKKWNMLNIFVYYNNFILCTGWVIKTDPLKMCLFTPYIKLQNGLKIPTSMSTFDSLHENPKRLKNMKNLQMKNMRFKEFLNFQIFTKKILCYLWSQNKIDAFSHISKPLRIFMKGIKCAQNGFLPTSRYFQLIL